MANLRCAVVEDEASLREDLLFFLDHADFSVVFESDGYDVLLPDRNDETGTPVENQSEASLPFSARRVLSMCYVQLDLVGTMDLELIDLRGGVDQSGSDQLGIYLFRILHIVSPLALLSPSEKTNTRRQMLPSFQSSSPLFVR